MRILLIILVLVINIYAITIGEIISQKELQELAKKYSDDEIKEIAKQRKKDTKDLDKLKKDIEFENKKFDEEKQKILAAAPEDLIEYCLNNFPILNSKGIRNNITICIAINKKLNSYVVKDILAQKVGTRMIEELLVERGKQLLRDDIKHSLNIDILYITQLSIEDR